MNNYNKSEGNKLLRKKMKCLTISNKKLQKNNANNNPPPRTNNISNLQWLSHRDNIIKYHESIRPDDYIPIEERTYKNYYNKYYKRKYYYYNDIRFKTYSELASYLNLTVGQIRLFCKKHNIKRRA